MTTQSPRQSSPHPRMSEAQVEARANQRAYDQRVHIFAVPGRPGVYTTKSKSDPRERYALHVLDGIVACSCTGFAYRRSCKHAEALKNRLAREAARAASTWTTMSTAVNP